MPYFMERPRIVNAVQWDGDNLTEVEAWASTNAPWATQFVQDGDVLTLPLNGMVLQAGDYLTSNWMLAADQVGNYQEVPAEDYRFMVEQDV